MDPTATWNAPSWCKEHVMNAKQELLDLSIKVCGLLFKISWSCLISFLIVLFKKYVLLIKASCFFKRSAMCIAYIFNTSWSCHNYYKSIDETGATVYQCHSITRKPPAWNLQPHVFFLLTDYRVKATRSMCLYLQCTTQNHWDCLPQDPCQQDQKHTSKPLDHKSKDRTWGQSIKGQYRFNFENEFQWWPHLRTHNHELRE